MRKLRRADQLTAAAVLLLVVAGGWVVELTPQPRSFTPIVEGIFLWSTVAVLLAFVVGLRLRKRREMESGNGYASTTTPPEDSAARSNTAQLNSSASMDSQDSTSRSDR